MKTSHVTHGKAKETSHQHLCPEHHCWHHGGTHDGTRLRVDNDQRDEQERGIDVVQQLQGPNIVIDQAKYLFGVDGVQGDKERGQDSKDDSRDGQCSKSVLLIDSKGEAKNDGATA